MGGVLSFGDHTSLFDAQAGEGWKADVLHENVVDQTDNVMVLRWWRCRGRDGIGVGNGG